MNQPGCSCGLSLDCKIVDPANKSVSATKIRANIVLRRVVWSRIKPRVACAANDKIDNRFGSATKQSSLTRSTRARSQANPTFQANPLLTDKLRCFHNDAMKKAKTKSGRPRKTQPVKRKPARKGVKKRGSTLQARLETEFAQALKSAKSYVKEPERLRGLVKEAALKTSSMPKEAFKGTWAYFQAMLRLIRAYYRGDYRNVAIGTLLIIIAAILYVVNPFDLIPDWVPGLGLLDDAFVVGFAVRKTQRTLDDFMAWEIATP